MMLPPFEYYEPKTLREACNLLSQHTAACVLAGGTDLLVEMKEGQIKPSCLIDIKGIGGLDALDYDENNGLRIGTLATIRSVELNPLIREKYPPLYQAARVFASPQIRNRATIGGNICHAIPSADMLPPLIALGASLRIMALSSEKKVGIEEFFTGVRKNILAKGEVLIEIEIPPMPIKARGAYLKHTFRRAMDLALLGVAVVIERENEGSRCKDIKIVLGAVAPTPIRARSAEALLRGQDLTEAAVLEAAKMASTEIHPRRGSMRSSPEYRREMTKVFVKRTIWKALENSEDK